MRRPALRLLIAAVVLTVALVVGATAFGRAPAVGAFLDPAHGVWALARADQPPRDATIPSLGQSVRVVYDTRGVPHIFAANEEDAYRALGYVVARDRLFQIYIQDLAASGRLTEVAGAAALDADREMRRLGLVRAAERGLAGMDTTSASWRLLRAYGDGINTYIDRLPAANLPFEFRLLGTRPERWRPVDALYMLGRMGWTLAYIAPEVNRARAAALVGTAAAASLFPENDPIQEPIQPNGQHAPTFLFGRLAPPGPPDSAAHTIAGMLDSLMPSRLASADVLDDEPRWLASNNWAVAPQRSASGHALLEGDPHLELTLPSIWYEAHLVVPGQLDVYGVTIPGIPGIVIGFNRDVAWTFTNTGADVLDLYRETVDNADRPTRYLLDGAWKPLQRQIDRYRGRHSETVATDTLYFTHRGPMHRDGDRWLSLRWTVLEPGDEADCFHRAARARSAPELESTMAECYTAPAQNMLSADRSGNIMIRSTGRFPIRPGDGSGLVVRDGSSSANDWRGYLPLDQYPQALNPAQHYLASANQQPEDPRSEKSYFGGSYDPWRAMRINQLLRADSTVTVDDMRRFETDPGSARADLFVPYFLSAAEHWHARNDARVASVIDTAKLHLAGRLLAQWDRRYTVDNTRAVLFEAAMRSLVDHAWDKLTVDGMHRVATPSLSVLAELLADSTSAWWEHRGTPGMKRRDDIVAWSLVNAFDQVRRRYGEPDAGGWTWSRIRQQNIFHLLRLPALSSLGILMQGGPETLNPSSGAGTHGASWRMVVELGPELRAWATYPGGQSGNPMSARYKDHLPFWERGELEPLLVPRGPAELDAAHRSAAITLRPATR